jgi:hypothetical protein
MREWKEKKKEWNNFRNLTSSALDSLGFRSISSSTSIANNTTNPITGIQKFIAIRTNWIFKRPKKRSVHRNMSTEDLLESHKNSDWDVKIILVSDSGGIPE